MADSMVDESQSVLGKRKQRVDASEELLQSILKQVEFYFSDSNLPRDKFLTEETKKNNGWVDIATIASFKRMKQLTTDSAVVVEALRHSMKLLQLDDKEEKVKRKIPLPTAEEMEAQKLRTVHYGFMPKEKALDEVKAFFSKFGTVNSVRMLRDRKDKDKFSGFGFVEYASQAEAEAIANSPPKFNESDEKPLKVLTHAGWVKDSEERKKNYESKKSKKQDRDFGESKEAAAAPQGLEFKADMLFEVSNLPADTTFIDVKQSVGAVLFPENEGTRYRFYCSIKEAESSTKDDVEMTDDSKPSTEEADATKEKSSEEAEKSSEGKPAVEKEADAPPSKTKTVVSSVVRLHFESEFTNASAIEKLKTAQLKIKDATPEYRAISGDEEKSHWDQYQKQRAASGSRGGRGRGRGRGRGGRGGRKRGFRHR